MPTLTIQPTGAFAQDTYLSSTNSSTPAGLETSLYVGDEGDNARRGIIEFPLRNIRAGATITDASLTLSSLTSPGAAFIGTCERVARYDWDQVEATWDNFAVASPWTTAGGDVAANTPGSATFTISTSGDVVITGSSFISMVQDALDSRAARLLLRLRGPDSGADVVEVASGQNTDTSKAPSLLVTANEDDLGYTFPGIKSAASNWIISRDRASALSAGAVAIGIGSSPATGYKQRRRLEEEVFRKPLIGTSLDSEAFQADIWAYFGAGEGSGTITEIGLFASDTTLLLDACESTTNWSGTDWTITTDSTRKEGKKSVAVSAASPNTNTITRSGLSSRLTVYNEDDYLIFWFYKDAGATLTSLQVQLADEQGTWTWSDISSTISNDWNHVRIQFGDATFASTVLGQVASGPSLVTSISFPISAEGDFKFDHIRVQKYEEDILLWTPPTGGSVAKAIGDTFKVRITLAAKRGTN